MRFLIDEQLSPSPVERIAKKRHFAQHAAHIGRSGRSDAAVWRLAYERDQIVITANAGDFLTLAAGADLHPGLIVLRESGLSRDEQWACLAPVIDHLASNDVGLINQVVEVWREGEFSIRRVPLA